MAKRESQHKCHQPEITAVDGLPARERNPALGLVLARSLVAGGKILHVIWGSICPAVLMTVGANELTATKERDFGGSGRL